MKADRRTQGRIRGVLPVRVRGMDDTGETFEALVHTLDLTPTGARLGSVRRQLKALDTLTVSFRQRRIDFRVVWTKLLHGTAEYQVGLKAFSQEKDAWGLRSFHPNRKPLVGRAASHAAIA